MSASYLIFDFGGSEDAAQQARQRLENWARGFRLGNKLAMQFDRDAEEGKEAQPGVRMIVRVDFSDHEKLSRQRWLERIPADEAFKSHEPRLVSPGDAAYAETEERFITLASGASSGKKFQ